MGAHVGTRAGALGRKARLGARVGHIARFLVGGVRAPSWSADFAFPPVLEVEEHEVDSVVSRSAAARYALDEARDPLLAELRVVRVAMEASYAEEAAAVARVSAWKEKADKAEKLAAVREADAAVAAQVAASARDLAIEEFSRLDERVKELAPAPAEAPATPPTAANGADLDDEVVQESPELDAAAAEPRPDGTVPVLAPGGVERRPSRAMFEFVDEQTPRLGGNGAAAALVTVPVDMATPLSSPLKTVSNVNAAKLYTSKAVVDVLSPEMPKGCFAGCRAKK